MTGFDDKFGKGALDRVRKAASLPGWSKVVITEPDLNQLRFRWSGKKGTAEVGLTWLEDGRVNWYGMTVDPPGGGFLSALAAKLGPVLHELGVTEMRISADHRAFEAVGFERTERGLLAMDVARCVEYRDWKVGKRKKPKWRRDGKSK